jgi:hypothetical protein
MDAFIRKIRDKQGIKLYIDWHSYSQLILFPFGHKETLYAPELGMWTKAANLVSETIRGESANATTFNFGPSGATIYPTTGASIDHVYTIGRARFSFTIELPDAGDYGFILPPERIRATRRSNGLVSKCYSACSMRCSLMMRARRSAPHGHTKQANELLGH